jgi:hypothetical protein
MRSNKLRPLSESAFIAGQCLAIALTLRVPLLPPGPFLMGDRTFPLTRQTAFRMCQLSTQFFVNTRLEGQATRENGYYWIRCLQASAMWLFDNGAFWIATQIYVTYAVSIFGMYFLLRELGHNRAYSIAGGWLFGLSPIAFNWTTMGWDNIHLQFAFLPIAIVLWNRTISRYGCETRLFPIYVTGLVTGLFAFLSSLAPVYLGALLCVVLYSRPRRATALGIGLLVLGMLSPHAFWIAARAPLLLATTRQLAVEESSVSYGTSMYVGHLTTLTGWGGQFNQSFERAAWGHWDFVGLAVVIVFVAGLLQSNRRRKIEFLIGLIALHSVGLSLLDQDLVIDNLLIRFGIGRDSGRILATSMIAAVPIIIYGAQGIYSSIVSKRDGPRRSLFYVCVIATYGMLMVAYVQPYLSPGLVQRNSPAQPSLNLAPAAEALEGFREIESYITSRRSMSDTFYVIPNSTLVTFQGNNAYNLSFQTANSVWGQIAGGGNTQSTASPEITEFDSAVTAAIYARDISALMHLLKSIGSDLLIINWKTLVREEERSFYDFVNVFRRDSESVKYFNDLTDVIYQKGWGPNPPNLVLQIPANTYGDVSLVLNGRTVPHAEVRTSDTSYVAVYSRSPTVGGTDELEIHFNQTPNAPWRLTAFIPETGDKCVVKSIERGNPISKDCMRLLLTDSGSNARQLTSKVKQISWGDFPKSNTDPEPWLAQINLSVTGADASTVGVVLEIPAQNRQEQLAQLTPFAILIVLILLWKLDRRRRAEDT